MGEAGDFWDNYFGQVKLWVTETSCSGDLSWDRLTNIRHSTPGDSCAYITGQDCQHKEGSVAAILGLDNIERFSWFTLFPKPDKCHPNCPSIMAAAMMNNPTNESRPVGRAFLNYLDAEGSDCKGPDSQEEGYCAKDCDNH